MEHFESKNPGAKYAFKFDGDKVDLSRTPEQLEMEDDDQLVSQRHRPPCGCGLLTNRGLWLG